MFYTMTTNGDTLIESIGVGVPQGWELCLLLVSFRTQGRSLQHEAQGVFKCVSFPIHTSHSRQSQVLAGPAHTPPFL